MKKILLDGAWEGMQSSNGNTFLAAVPGCVHTDLMKNGQLPENLYWRDTAEQVQWIEKEDWVDTRQFTVDALEEGAVLVFECLDTYAGIYLNEQLVGSAENMFITHRFPVDGILRQGENTLRVEFPGAADRRYAGQIGGIFQRPPVYPPYAMHLRLGLDDAFCHLRHLQKLLSGI